MPLPQLPEQDYFTVTQDDPDTVKLTAWRDATCLSRMEEPSLRNVGADAAAKVFRLLILPTWSNPIAVRTTVTDGIYTLHARRLNGQGGYDPGRLTESRDEVLSRHDSAEMDHLLAEMNFFSIPADDNVYGLDGTQWALEGVQEGRHQVIHRWCPNQSIDERGLGPFMAFCTFLLTKSKFPVDP